LYNKKEIQMFNRIKEHTDKVLNVVSWSRHMTIVFSADMAEEEITEVLKFASKRKLLKPLDIRLGREGAKHVRIS